jgi:hypothetical protein
MNVFWRCLSAEVLKTRRTIYLLAVFAMPTMLSLFNFLLHVGLTHTEGYYATADGWMSFAHNTFTFWAILVLPSLVVLISAFVAHQEHDNKQWRRLMCLGVPWAPIYLAKSAVVIGLMLLSTILLWAEDIVWGWLIILLRPELGLSFSTFSPWHMFMPFGLICLYCFFIAAIHQWFSLRANNFVLSIGLGLALILAGFFLHDIDVIRIVFPWSLPATVYQADTLAVLLGGLAYSLAGWAAVTATGCWDFARQDVLS